MTVLTTFNIIPRINQNEFYLHVYDTLAKSNCVGIFPEGGSHDRTELLPLKAGIAVIALGAMSHYPGLNVKIDSCGMNYSHPDYETLMVIQAARRLYRPKNKKLKQKF